MPKRKAFSFNDAYEQIPTVDFAGQGSNELLRRFFRQIDAPKRKHATRRYLDLAAAVGPALVGNKDKLWCPPPRFSDPSRKA